MTVKMLPRSINPTHSVHTETVMCSGVQYQELSRDRGGLTCGCRVELCSADGGTLKAFSLDECQGAPHEFRGVKRATLLEALQSIVPESCIEYGAAIHSVETDQNGTHTLPHCCSNHLSMLVC